MVHFQLLLLVHLACEKPTHPFFPCQNYGSPDSVLLNWHFCDSLPYPPTQKTNKTTTTKKPMVSISHYSEYTVFCSRPVRLISPPRRSYSVLVVFLAFPHLGLREQQQSCLGWQYMTPLVNLHQSTFLKSFSSFFTKQGWVMESWSVDHFEHLLVNAVKYTI